MPGGLHIAQGQVRAGWRSPPTLTMIRKKNKKTVRLLLLRLKSHREVFLVPFTTMTFNRLYFPMNLVQEMIDFVDESCER